MCLRREETTGGVAQETPWHPPIKASFFRLSKSGFRIAGVTTANTTKTADAIDIIWGEDAGPSQRKHTGKRSAFFESSSASLWEAFKATRSRQAGKQTDGQDDNAISTQSNTQTQHSGLRIEKGNETHHRCPSIRRIHSAVIFRRCLIVVVGRSLYFSSSLMGSTLANQKGKSAGSLGGWP